jgi:hypothetical protein
MAGRTGKAFIAAGLLALVPTLSFAQKQNPWWTPGHKTAATQEQVCAPDFKSTIKPVPASSRSNALHQYGKRDDYTGTLDLLIPASLGGSTDPQNLWPMPENKEYGPEWKDALEAKLHEMVCSGKLTLKDAQDTIRKDWVKAYDQYIKNAAN